MNKIVFFLMLFSLGISAQESTPIELGKVNWQRDYDLAIETAQVQDKPILLFFQEVPGCSTCSRYGTEVMSHPFIVEIIESHFIPVVVYNNKKGADAKILQKYKEPSWNNPVVRFVNGKEKNIIPRLSGNYSPLGLTQALIQVMDLNSIAIPPYFLIYKEELESADSEKEAIVSMGCFWTGEKKLGDIDGVVNTEAGWMGGKEVVVVRYNSEQLSYGDLMKEAKAVKCANAVFTDDENEMQTAKKHIGYSVYPTKKYTIDRTPRYYLNNSMYQFIPMTDLQATRVNSLVGNGQTAIHLLSPRQKALFLHIQDDRAGGWENMVGEDFTSAWWKIWSQSS